MGIRNMENNHRKGTDSLLNLEGNIEIIMQGRKMWVPISFPKDDVLINWWFRKRHPFTDSEPVPNAVV